MFTTEDMDRINVGMKKCVMLQGGMKLQCTKCKHIFPLGDHFPEGIPLWVLSGMVWGFAHQHFDCEEEVDDTTT